MLVFISKEKSHLSSARSRQLRTPPNQTTARKYLGKVVGTPQVFFGYLPFIFQKIRHSCFRQYLNFWVLLENMRYIKRLLISQRFYSFWYLKFYSTLDIWNISKIYSSFSQWSR